METKMTQFIEKNALLRRDDRVLVAVSGGIDSVVLTHLLHRLGYKIDLAHVNYKLRSEDSDSDEQFVRQLADELNVKCFIEVPWQEKPATGIQAKAREVRYGFFDRIAKEHGYTAIATAHHADDMVEGVLLNLMRGTGIYGLKGIPVKRGLIIRPLLYASRQEITDFAIKEGLLFRQDLSNEGDGYLRNRIRHRIVPLLHEIDDTALQKLRTSAEILAKDAGMIKRFSASLIHPEGDGFIVHLDGLPEEDQATWLYHAIKDFGFGRQQCLDLLSAKEVGKKMECTDFIAQKTKQGIAVASRMAKPFNPLKIMGIGHYLHEGIELDVRNVERENSLEGNRSENAVYLDGVAVDFPLILRRMKKGDRFQPIGLNYEVELNKYLRDKGWSAISRRSALLITDNSDRVCWIPGQGLAAWCVTNVDSSKILSISFDRNEA